MKPSSANAMKSFSQISFLTVFLLSVFNETFAAPVQVLAPIKMTSSVSGKNYSKSFPASGNNLNGVLTITNGNGQDYSLKNCNGLGIVAKVLCLAGNVLKEVAVAIDRPAHLEVKLNNQLLFASNGTGNVGWSKYRPNYQLAIKVNQSNSLNVLAKGLPTSSVTISATAESSAVNQLPIAVIDVNPPAGVAPAVISFSALRSSDADGNIVSYAWDFDDGKFGSGASVTHLYTVAKTYNAKLTVTDNQGGVGTKTLTIVISADVTAPVLSLSSPAEGSLIRNQAIQIVGTSNEKLTLATAALNGESAYSLNLSPDGFSFSGSIATTINGNRTLTVTGKDVAGNVGTKVVSFNYDNSLPPLAKLTLKSASQGVAPFMVLLDGSQSSDPAGQALAYAWDFGDGTISAVAQIATHTFTQAGSYTIKMKITNQSGLTDEKSVQVVVNALTLPVDPVTIATPLVQNNIPVSFSDSTAFIYEGPNALQQGVAANAIDKSRVSILRGQIVDDNNQPISGVRVSVNRASEYGFSYSRNDGFFDIAVNGGSTTTLTYEKTGYLPVQRSMKLGFNEFATNEKVVLVSVDPSVTKVLNGSTVPQVASGSLVTDTSGSRTAKLMIPAGANALVELPDGGTLALSSLSLRVTEYTVGPNGPKRMPASLPKSTDYTYAFDVTADEALALGAKHINFSKPVSVYTDNFLGFSTGTVIPFGTYDYDRALWLTNPNARVIKILAISGGVAQLDVDGSGNVANASQLAVLNIDTSELQKIAQLYPTVGKTFWRAQTSRFSPGDMNQIVGSGGAPPENGVDSNDSTPKPCERCATGSIIEVMNQNLKEIIPIKGTELNLLYSSGRSNSSVYTLNINLTNPLSIPVQLQQVDLKVEVAGQVFEQSFTPSVGLKYLYKWDGFDAYGRKVDGRTKAKVTIAYRFPGNYLAPALNYPWEFGMYSVGLIDTGVPGREYGEIARTYETYIGNGSTTRGSIGEWTLTDYHSYDPNSKILYMGDGTSVGDINPIFSPGRPIQVVIGNGTPGFSADGTLASQGQITSPHPITVGSDKSIYFSDAYPLIRKINQNGFLETVAGNGQYGFSGDGGLAIDAKLGNGLNSVKIVEGEKGDIYIADIGNYRIRKIDANGIITTIAGNGTNGFSGDGGPARSAQIGLIFHLFYHEGSIFIVDSFQFRVREVTAAGTIRTVLGTGVNGFSADGTPALSAQVSDISGIGFNSDGELIFSDTGNKRIRKINKLGNLETIVGTGILGNSPDGTAILQADIGFPADMKVRPDGSIFWREGADRIHYSGTDGKLHTLIGGAQSGFSVPGTFAADALLNGIRQFDFSADGEVYIVEQGNHRIIKISDPVNATKTAGVYTIVSENGDEIYYFDSFGIHFKTAFALTNATKYEFVHNAVNKLVAIKDSFGNITTLNRDSSGNVTSAVSNYGITSNLTYDASGRLASISLPSGDKYQMSYDSINLLTSFSKPNGATSILNYDTNGKLVKDTNANGGFTQLVRSSGPTGDIVTMNSASGTSWSHSKTEGATQVFSEIKFKNGEQLFSSLTGNLLVDTYSTGYSEASYEVADPFFGGQTRRTNGRQIVNGLARTELTGRVYDRQNSKTDYKFTDTLQVNGQVRSTASFDSATLESVNTSFLGVAEKIKVNQFLQPIFVQKGTLAPTSFQYDSKGRFISSTTGSKTTALTYNTQGMLETITDPLGQVTAFEYDANLNKTKITSPDGKYVLFSYNPNGDVVSVTPFGRPQHLFNIGFLSEILNYIAPNVPGVSSGQTTYEYDVDNRRTKTTRPDGKVAVFAYVPGKDLLQSITTFFGNYGFQYNSNGQLVQATSPDGVVTATSYLARKVSSEAMSGASTGTVSWTFNSLLKVASVTAGGIASNYTYDRDERPTFIGSEGLTYDLNDLISTIVLQNVLQTNSYDQFGNLTSKVTSFSGAPLMSQVYSFDNLDRIVRKIDNGTVFDYGYDLKGQLSTVSKNGSSVGQYQYDDNGNRLQATVRGVSFSATYDNQDRILSYGTKSYTYNDAGDLTSETDSSTGKVKVYNYDLFSNLRSATVDGKSIQYLVDARDRRVAKKINGIAVQRFIYQSQVQVAAELAGDGSLISRFEYGSMENSPDFMLKSGVLYKFIHDQLGSVRMVVNSSTGVVVQEMNYDEFGNVLSDTNPGFQPFGFGGGIYDRDTGLIRFGKRDYNPEVGRWVSKDPILFEGGDTNLYGYVLQDPVNGIDPEGLRFPMQGIAETAGSGVPISPAIGAGIGASIAANIKVCPIKQKEDSKRACYEQHNERVIGCRKLPFSQSGKCLTDSGVKLAQCLAGK